MRVLVVIEDDPDVQFLIVTLFSADARFTFGGVATSAEDVLAMPHTTEPGIIILDYGLAGALTGLEAAPQIKAVAPLAKIILFTAHAELRDPARDEHAIDAFLLKTDISRLLPLAQRLSGFGPPSSSTEGRVNGAR